jgi:RNA polymerase sigma factor (sigma-70 family)
MAQLPNTRHSLLVRLAEPNDSAAWSEFLATYEGAVLRYCRSRGLQEADACDVVQEVLLAVHDAAKVWKPSGRVGSFRAWLIRTAHNICLKTLHVQSRGDRGTGGTEVHEMLKDLSTESESSLEDDGEWQRWAFYWAASQVERDVLPITWQAFWLAAVEGMPPAEIAQRLQMRVGSVYAAKCRVMDRIRERIQELSRCEP